MQALAGVHVLAVGLDLEDIVLSQIVEGDAVVLMRLGAQLDTVEADRVDLVRDEVGESAGSLVRVELDAGARCEISRPCRQVERNVVVEDSDDFRASRSLFSGEIQARHGTPFAKTLLGLAWRARIPVIFPKIRPNRTRVV